MERNFGGEFKAFAPNAGSVAIPVEPGSYVLSAEDIGIKIGSDEEKQQRFRPSTPNKVIKALKETFLPAAFIMTIILTVLIIFLSFSAHAADIAPDYYGATSFYGVSGARAGLGPDPAEDTTWMNVSGLVGYEYKPWLHFQGSLGAGYIDTESADSPTAELSLAAHFIYHMLYFDINAGCTHLFEPNDFAEIEKTWIYGTFGFGIGLNITDNASLGYRFKHISSPFWHGRNSHDTGLNVGALELEWRF